MKTKENEMINDLLEYLETDTKDLKDYIENNKNDLAKKLIDIIIDNLKDLKKEL